MHCGVIEVRKSVAQLGAAALLIAIPIALAGCSSPSEPDPQPKEVVFESALSSAEATRARVARTDGSRQEWRDAVLFEADRDHILDFTGLSRQGALRFAVMSTRGEGDIAYEVTAAGEVISSGTVDADSPWEDIQLALPALASPADGYSLNLRSGGDFWVSTAERFPLAARTTHVVVFLIDTLRQDHLGCYGYGRPTSPNIDLFAKDAILCTQLMPSSSWTRPSVASLLTSTYPERHGAQDRGARIRADIPWITTPLKEAGYETHGINTNVNLLPIWGFGDPFQRYIDLDSSNWVENHDAKAVDEAIDVLSTALKWPTFLYVHTMSPHEPFDPPEPFRSRFTRKSYEGTLEQKEQAETVDLYDGEIARVDLLFGKLIGFMRAVGMYDSTLIVLLSDHGEELWERGRRGHGNSLYEEQLRVPLLIKLPRNRMAGSHYDGLIEMVDIAPTILDILGLPEYGPFEGRSVLAGLKGEAAADRVGYASLHLDAASMRAAKTVEQKYILDLVAKKQSWFNLVQDPEERHVLTEEEAGDPGLSRYVAYRSAVGASGFHVLVTHDSTRPLDVSLSLTSASAPRYELFYPKSMSDVEVADDTLEIRLNMPEAEDKERASAQWQEGLKADTILQDVLKLHKDELKTEQNHALLVVPAELHESVTLKVTIEGEPVDLNDVYFGADHHHQMLDGSAIELRSLVASPNLFDPASLPRRFGVYLWYVPSAETIEDSELPPEVLEALEALGYIK